MTASSLSTPLKKVEEGTFLCDEMQKIVPVEDTWSSIRTLNLNLKILLEATCNTYEVHYHDRNTLLRSKSYTKDLVYNGNVSNSF